MRRIMVTTDDTSKTITLKDGRTLGYAEYGSRRGKQVFFFHGNPSSRLGGRLMDEAANEVNARIIAVDRPGIGLSDFKPGRQYLDWPDDVSELADLLRVDYFAILGLSSGVPHAAACAFKIPDRISSVAIVSGPCPFNVPAATEQISMTWRIRALAGQKAPWLVSFFFGIIARSARHDPVSAISRTLGGLPEPDRVVMARPEVMQWSSDSLREAFRSGPRGAAWDFALFTRPWGFRLDNLSVKVQLWHGELDATIPIRVGHYMAEVVPNCQARFLPDEGHISLIANHAKEILNDLVA
jgi:pimeloyl-ACP methyl ester carboxylesterase